MSDEKVRLERVEKFVPPQILAPSAGPVIIPYLSQWECQNNSLFDSSFDTSSDSSFDSQRLCKRGPLAFQAKVLLNMKVLALKPNENLTEWIWTPQNQIPNGASVVEFWRNIFYCRTAIGNFQTRKKLNLMKNKIKQRIKSISIVSLQGKIYL